MPIFSLALSGDVIPTRRLNAASAQARQAAQPLFDMLDAADIAIGNFEIPLSTRGAPLEKLLNIRAHPELAADLPRMGFNVLNVANNHTVDYGWEGLSDTVQALRDVGMATVGAGASLAQAAMPVTVDAQGRRIGVLAFSCLLPTGMAATEQRPGLSPLHVETAYEIDPYYQMEEPGDPSCVRIRTRIRSADLERAVADIRRLRAEVDVLVATVHWGFGSGEELAEYQQPLAHALIDSGADIIHGHHPHAVHAIGFYRGKPIFYSLGTFIGQQIFLPAPPVVQALWGGMSADGYLAHVRFDEAGKMGEIRLVPTMLNAERLPMLAEGEDFVRIADRLQRLSGAHGATVTIRDGALIVREQTSNASLARAA